VLIPINSCIHRFSFEKGYVTSDGEREGISAQNEDMEGMEGKGYKRMPETEGPSFRSVSSFPQHLSPFPSPLNSCTLKLCPTPHLSKVNYPLLCSNSKVLNLVCADLCSFLFLLLTSSTLLKPSPNFVLLFVPCVSDGALQPGVEPWSWDL
jgi:hypothetical protein